MKNLIRERFGKLIVEKFIRQDKYYNCYWLCKCDCGGKTISTSCGCLQKEGVSKLMFVHGFSHSRIQGIWENMKQRCLNPKAARYNRYGERGIKICNSWEHSLKNFAEWALKNGYKNNLTIDRINNNGNYSPRNCRWVTNKVNCNNK